MDLQETLAMLAEAPLPAPVSLVKCQYRTTNGEWFTPSDAYFTEKQMLEYAQDFAAQTVESSRVNSALDLVSRFGQIDGEHHKTWVIDQVCRTLLGDKYDTFISEYCDGENGKDTYSWDIGVAP